MSGERERPPPEGKITSEINRLLRQLTALEQRLNTLPGPHHPVAVPCAIIMNELITNSLKYAFPDERPCEIRIGLHIADRTMQLTASDTGVGFPPDLDFQRTASLGLQLVCMLTEQLGGTIALERTGGTNFALTVPLDPQPAWGGRDGHGADSHC